jgi:Lipocalin-like domain
MNRSSFFIFSTIATFALTVMPTGAVAQQKSLKEQLVGSWTPVSQEATAPNGTKEQPFGANPKGVLILDASGRYSWALGRPDRPKFKATGDFRTQGTTEELASAVRGFAANYGTWSVNEADKTLIRLYEGALIPNAEGSELKAVISLSGDELKLVTTSAVGVRTETAYRRAK